MSETMKYARKDRIRLAHYMLPLAGGVAQMASATVVLNPSGESDPSELLPSQSPVAQEEVRPAPARRASKRSLDLCMLAGVAIALGGTILGIKSTGVSLTYFFQPAGALIVLGATFGIALISTPRNSLVHAANRVMGLLWSERPNRETLIEEIVSYAKIARMKGLLSIDHMMDSASSGFLRDTVRLAMDVANREELQSTLETKVRLRERQGETDARVLEVAGGFAPTIGVLGTVVGLINVLRQFSNLSAVALGIGTAFVSTVYGLALANLVLLPAAHRIRASVAETFDLEEMMVEGGLCLFDGIHPSLIRERLNNFLRTTTGR
jgi:chemotaxis protein MotA